MHQNINGYTADRIEGVQQVAGLVRRKAENILAPTDHDKCLRERVKCVGWEVNQRTSGLTHMICLRTGAAHSPVDWSSTCRYPREEWRPVPVGSQPAVEPVWERPVRV